MAGRFEGLGDLAWPPFADAFPPGPRKRGRGLPPPPFRKVVNTWPYVLIKDEVNTRRTFVEIELSQRDALLWDAMSVSRSRLTNGIATPSAGQAPFTTSKPFLPPTSRLNLPV